MFTQITLCTKHPNPRSGKRFSEKIFVDEGQYVSAARTRFRIMPQLYSAELLKAKAEVEQATIELENASTLASNNIVSKNEKAMAKAKLDAANAEMKLAQIHLSFTDIKAPFSGIINRIPLKQGSLVDEGDLMTSLSNNTEMYSYFNVSEPEYLNYQTHINDRGNLKTEFAKSRNIKIAYEIPDLYVISSGLADGDRFLLEGVQKVKDDQKVQTKFQEPEKVMQSLKLKAESTVPGQTSGDTVSVYLSAQSKHTASYPGANNELLIKSVVIPLERGLNGVPGMKYMTSDAGNDGEASIQVVFDLGTDPNVAAVNVQNRCIFCSQTNCHPCVREGVKITREEPNMLMYIHFVQDGPKADQKFLFNYADINVMSELRRVMEALNQQSLEASPGKTGESSGKRSHPLSTVRNIGAASIMKQTHGNIILKAKSGGEFVRLKDVADVEFGSSMYDIYSTLNGKPSAAITVKQSYGSNASDVIKKCKRTDDRSSKEQLPQSISHYLKYDFTFCPLVDGIGGGSSIDAIVVIEAVHAKMEEKNLSPLKATEEAMHEISGAIIAITLPPSIPGYGAAGGFELRLLDKAGSGDYQKMEQVSNDFVKELKKRPELGSAFTFYSASFPQYMLKIDNDLAEQKEVSGSPAPGYSSGQAIKAIQEVANSKLPRGFGIDWAGISKDESDSFSDGHRPGALGNRKPGTAAAGGMLSPERSRLARYEEENPLTEKTEPYEHDGQKFED
ncbi:hypothetical protein FQR65_LT16654 [Abscondita terminalis]|nr:hypothetical protein FQR65_LT16654 [Abscondita terminalis]